MRASGPRVLSLSPPTNRRRWQPNTAEIIILEGCLEPKGGFGYVCVTYRRIYLKLGRPLVPLRAQGTNTPSHEKAVVHVGAPGGTCRGCREYPKTQQEHKQQLQQK